MLRGGADSRRDHMGLETAPRDRCLTPPSTQEKYGMAVRLFIGNLPYDVTEAELRAHFAAIGPLSFLALPMDRDTGKPRGFAFIEFSARADAEDAMRRLNNQLFKGRPLAVSEARARDDHAPPSAPRPTAPRPTAPRPPVAADTRPDTGRDFGPDAAPRRQRPPAKRAAHAERGPKHPIYKRTTGPVRFSAGDEDGDGDEEEVRGAHGTRRRTNAGEHDTA
jgi:RNA recognition motif-containing protein